MEEEEGGKVRVLIETATISTEPDVDPRLLKAIKSVVRYSDSELRLAARILMDLMKREHSQVRYLTLLIIDELFMRSKLFRTLVVENLDQLLTLSVGFRIHSSLPPPANVATALRKKAIEFLEKWNSSFGVHYKQIRLGFDYLKNTLKYQFPNLQETATRLQQERRERERKTKKILLKKFEILEKNFASIKEEIQSTVDEIGECLEIVRPKEEGVPFCPLDEEDMEEFHSYEFRQLRLQALEEGEKLHENSENKVVFDALRELYKILVKHLTAVQEWILVLVKVELTDNRSRDSYLKEFIDIRNNIQSVKKKCEELGCNLSNIAKHEEEDFWEEGKIETTEGGNFSLPNNRTGGLAVTSTSKEVQGSIPKCHDKENDANKRRSHEGGGSNSDPLRSKLLAEAPEVNWSNHLASWGSKMDVLANHRGLELESHWGRVDQDAVIPAEKIADLNLQATVYKEKQVEIQPCRAPLSNGKLCPRRDLRICPFHGPVIPRDDEGKPLNQNPPKDEKAPDLGTNLVEQLTKQAVQNVREKDKELARKRDIDKKALKRAKLAKIREHNEAVLRDSAIASTSKSAFIGEDWEPSTSRNPSFRNKKKTLASMLQKKETPKDRLARRILNTRASAATVRQLTLGEDANYREAFPNQW
ncbi:UV-stimulated scaffold protein A homolog [Pyrus communis]|uniref:UV-stimulated scaffold protein A homolog n=1 Tax=Pyrus communis TaxID=23211 RepID=UPI0035C25DF6